MNYFYSTLISNSVCIFMQDMQFEKFYIYIYVLLKYHFSTKHRFLIICIILFSIFSLFKFWSDFQLQPTESIPFLDTSIRIENNRIYIDLDKKKTDRNQYLLPSSCHPKNTTKSIPYSFNLRIVRIFPKKENRDKRLVELKELLLARQYPESLIDISM